MAPWTTAYYLFPRLRCGEFPTLRVWPAADVLEIFRYYDEWTLDWSSSIPASPAPI